MNPFPTSPRIAIVGSGAIGCYYGARLAQHGHDVHFLMRSDHDHVSRHGLDIRSHIGDFHLPADQVHSHTTTADIGPSDLVIIALKTTSNHLLPDLIPPLLHENTAILTLQNGLGNEALLATHFGAQRILGGLCFVCINRLSPGVIDHSAQGLITLGEYDSSDDLQSRPQTIAEAFNAAQIPCKVEPSLALARWRKLVWNIPFNGLSIAAGSLTTEQILASPTLTQLVHDLMLEVIATANALGHPLPESLADEMIANTRNMSAYKTSSLIDHLEGREVEINAIWQEPLRQAQAAGVPVPKLEMLTQLLAGYANLKTTSK
ncbi:2-dehydropantoate 2-reductase [Phragmitibacter flavus]|uniref:2-dehydropantoate 2-reductase n=1 Tax=Phragmitibacter flavus TaxID=2576071 RepID=A0A5R8KAY7_9BACT|nr:2-dehydropantoate 2-reductase [Phragmitibacter flavus]TLD69085.1 2-dehydropantoate 2-reductase [Phragmitibacter flavus]